MLRLNLFLLEPGTAFLFLLRRFLDALEEALSLFFYEFLFSLAPGPSLLCLLHFIDESCQGIQNLGLGVDGSEEESVGGLRGR